MTTFTAEVTGEAVTLTLADLTVGGELRIDRQPDSGIVRGTPTTIATGSGTVLTDVEYPFGQTLTYTAVIRDTDTGDTLEELTAEAGPINLGDTGVVLSNPLTGQEVLVTCLDERDAESVGRGYRFDLSGRVAPLHVMEFNAAWTWTADYLIPDQSDRATMNTLLRMGTPVLIRPAEGCDLYTGWAQPGDVRARRFSIPASDSRRVWEVDLSYTEAPDSTVEPVYANLQDLNDWEPTTLQTVADRVPTTLLDLTLTVIRSV